MLFIPMRPMGLAVAGLLMAAACSGSAQAGDPNTLLHGLTLFAVAYRPGPGWKPGVPMHGQPSLKEHFGYVKNLFQAGRVYAGGPLATDHGLLLFYAKDQSEADSIVANDPAIRSGTFIGEARTFAPTFLAPGGLAASKPAGEKGPGIVTE